MPLDEINAWLDADANSYKSGGYWEKESRVLRERELMMRETPAPVKG